MTYLHQFFVFFGQMLKMTREHCKKLMQVSIDSEINSLEHEQSKYTQERLCSLIYVLLLGLLMFIRFAERGTTVFYDLCVIVRVVDVNT
jgi:hypothetical protein